jgi:N-acetylneuraminate synthase
MQNINSTVRILDRVIGENEPVYFIADLAANHDGDLERAKDLIFMAKEAGADAAKFQHFSAETIVSDVGFQALGNQISHQASWKKSVFDVYKSASLNLDWTPILADTCLKAGIAFMTSPYDFNLVDHVDSYIPAFKIGSGDITWIEIIEYIAQKNKPVLLATGASSLDEVVHAVNAAIAINPDLVLMQCNTNYTASLDNFKYINLNVLKTYRDLFPKLILGLSDHTPGHATVLGAVALGARVIEKHFTDNVTRSGPDHRFSMDPSSWLEMVERTRELEQALGGGIKAIEENEKETSVVQRRSIRLSRDLDGNSIIDNSDLIALRPCPVDAISPEHIKSIAGRRLRHPKKSGDYIKWTDLE